MDRSNVNHQSCKHLGASHSREATLTAREFTAGGSGTVSTEAIAKKKPRIQTMHGFDFIPALHQDINHSRISGVVLLRRGEGRFFFSARRPNTALAAGFPIT
jgi:hypothetical protein